MSGDEARGDEGGGEGFGVDLRAAWWFVSENEDGRVGIDTSGAAARRYRGEENRRRDRALSNGGKNVRLLAARRGRGQSVSCKTNQAT